MAEEGKSEHQLREQRAPWRKINVIIFVIIFAVVASIVIYSSWAAAPGGSKGGAKTPSLSLSPASQKVPLSSSLKIEIWADTNSQPVNAVQANLSYPIDKLNFVNVDGTNSAFGLSVQGDGGNGVVTIARGSFQPISGKLLVATVNFTGANPKGRATVSFTNSTALLSSTTNQNILAGTYGGTYSLSP